MNNGQVGSESCFKVYYRNNEEIRRFAVDTAACDWCKFKKLIEQMFQIEMEQGRERLQYIDQEGERVTISCSLEWEEALNQMKSEEVKKLFLVEASGQTGPKDRNENQTSDTKTNPSGGFRCFQNIFGNPQVVESMKRMVSHIIKPNSSGETFEAELNMSELFGQIHQEALVALDQRHYEYAKCLLHSLLLFEPQNSVILYNLACTESLLGNKQRALELLGQSLETRQIDNKFVEHIKTDKDLDNLRNVPQFVQLLRSLESQVKPGEKESKEQRSDYKQEAPRTPNPTTTTVDPPSFEQELNLLAELGFTNDEHNLCLLNLLQGNTEAILNILLH